MKAEGFVLAGGRSSRMGQDKALLQLCGHPMVELALEKLRAVSLAAPPRIAGAQADLTTYAEVVPDRYPGCGPLSGIQAALASTSQIFNLFLPVDLPLLPSQFLRWLLCRAEITGALATVPRINGAPQPLCAVYHRALLEPITGCLLAGNYKVMSAVIAATRAADAIDVFDVEVVRSADPELSASCSLPAFRWFLNCNTPEDMAGMENALVLSQ